MIISEDIYLFFSNYIHKHLGIYYGEDDYYRLENRLKNLSLNLNFSSVSELFDAFKNGPTRLQHEELIKLATNNETYFFRDQKPFEALTRDVIPSLNRTFSQKKLSVWSAACSSGQEPYSICMQIKEKSPDFFTSLSVDASDISQNVLDKGLSGQYTSLELARGVGESLKKKYFKYIEKEKNWQIDREMKNKVNFFNFNLLDDHYPISKYDIIFCRNVLIYHPLKNRQKILDNMVAALKPDGFLLMGSGESLIGLEIELKQKMMGNAMYFQKDIKFSQAA